MNLKRLKILFRFFSYYFKAQTKYNIHSPFVFDFAEKVLEDDRWFYAFEEVEELRALLKSEKIPLEITDYGAGSQVSSKKVRTISSLAKYSATSPIYCRILFRLIQCYKPKTIVELGTSMGVSTLYQAYAAQNSEVISIEGCPIIAEKAVENFELMENENIRVVTGKFEKKLPEVLNGLELLDYVFLDGNHRKIPTLKYFELCLEKAHDETILVFDDIHWSTDMEAAWKIIQAHPKVTLTIDLFFFGIVFLRKEFKIKQHFTIIKSWWKPWQIGLKDFFSG